MGSDKAACRSESGFMGMAREGLMSTKGVGVDGDLAEKPWASSRGERALLSLVSGWSEKQ